METNDRIIGELIGKLDQHIQTQTAFMAEIRLNMGSIRDEKKQDHTEIYTWLRNHEEEDKKAFKAMTDTLSEIQTSLANNAGYKKGFLAAIALLGGATGSGITYGINLIFK